MGEGGGIVITAKILRCIVKARKRRRKNNEFFKELSSGKITRSSTMKKKGGRVYIYIYNKDVHQSNTRKKVKIV